MSGPPPLPPAPLDAVVAERRASGLTVAVVIPALDEVRTVADVVDGVMGLVTAGLVHEVVVVDGGSTDGTPAAATEAGARVLAQGSLPAGITPGRGKGDALWQGVAASSGDIVVFVDADIRGFDPDFVVRLVEPLLTDATVLLTKAAYDRPLGTTGAATGGGRVTELLARPVLATFWPELAALAQPLSGEYAGRRSLLESVPFVQGYGVELALLIDTLELHGRTAIRQVDLGVRHHAHQPLDALGRMAAELLAVGLERAERYGRQRVARPVLRQPTRGASGELILGDHPVTVAERPPLAG